MAHRPFNVNQTTVFVGTQPRPVNRDALSRRLRTADFPDGGGGDGAGGGSAGTGRTGSGSTAGGGGAADEMPPRRAAILVIVGTLMLAAGVFLVRGYQYDHLHQRIEEAYFGYLQDWERGYRETFAASEWSLEVEGVARPLPLRPLRRPSKRAAVPPGAVWPPGGGGDAGGAAGAADGSDEPRRGRVIAQSSLLEFRLEGLLSTLFFPSDASGAANSTSADGRGVGVGGDGGAAIDGNGDVGQPGLGQGQDQMQERTRLWRPVGQQLRLGRALALVATDAVTGQMSRLELGRMAFVRERSVAAGGEGRCQYDQGGVWQDDYTCAVQEYLAAICVKVTREPSGGAASGADGAVAGGGGGSSGGGGAKEGVYSLDTSLGGGPGCGAEWGWEAGQWRRLDARRHRRHGRLYLPAAARNATVVSIKHSRDPSVLEAEAVRSLAPNMEQQILMHAVGLALCFLGCVLLLSVAAFSASRLAAAARALLACLPGRGGGARGRRRRRGWGGGDGKDSGDELLGLSVRS